MANLKPTIDYNNSLIKAQYINIVAVSGNGTHLKTHSERLTCIKGIILYRGGGTGPANPAAAEPIIYGEITTKDDLTTSLA